MARADAGAHALGEALKVNSTLTLLDISLNNISAVESLAAALEGNCALRFLDLQWIHIRDAGSEALAKALKVNRILASLNVGTTTSQLLGPKRSRKH